MSNGSIEMLLSWCPRQSPPAKCDPCKHVGNIEIVGNYVPYDPDTNTPLPGGPYALVNAFGSIIVWPEFPVVVTAQLELKGIYRPGIGYIANDGGGVGLQGQSNNLGVPCPLPSTFLASYPNWNPNGSDLLWFNVQAKSSTTSGAGLSATTVTVLYHDAITGTVTNLLYKTRWTGNTV